MAWTTPRTWVAGETVTAALMNAHVRDNLRAIGGFGWTTFTPSWFSNSTAPSIGNGTLSGRYINTGATVLMAFELVGGSTTNWGAGLYEWAYPKLPASSSAFGGWMYGENLNSTGYYFLPRFSISSRWEMAETSSVTNGLVNATVASFSPFTWATGDYIRGYMFYEAA